MWIEQLVMESRTAEVGTAGCRRRRLRAVEQRACRLLSSLVSGRAGDSTSEKNKPRASKKKKNRAGVWKRSRGVAGFGECDP